MFIRETELVRLDDWADKVEKRVVSGVFLKHTKDQRKTSLVRENEHLSELRLEEGISGGLEIMGYNAWSVVP